MNDHTPTPGESRNARVGLILFVVYVALYGTFVFLSAFRPEVMSMDALRGVNLAVVYGLGLIAAALLLALVYMVICRDRRGEGRA